MEDIAIQPHLKEANCPAVTGIDPEHKKLSSSYLIGIGFVVDELSTVEEEWSVPVGIYEISCLTIETKNYI